MAASDKPSDESLYPIAVLIDELKNEDIQVSVPIKGEMCEKNEKKKFRLQSERNKNGDEILVITVHIGVVIKLIAIYDNATKSISKCIVCMRNLLISSIESF